MNGNAEEWARMLLDKGKEFGIDLIELFHGAVSLSEIIGALTKLVQVAEVAITGPGAGVTKKQAVLAVIELLKADHRLVQRIDDAIKLPIWAEPFDAKIIEFVLDRLVDVIVAVLNRVGAWSIGVATLGESLSLPPDDAPPNTTQAVAGAATAAVAYVQKWKEKGKLYSPGKWKSLVSQLYGADGWTAVVKAYPEMEPGAAPEA